MLDQKYPYPITVLMPAFNAEKYLKEAIDSILNQTFADFEFLIIDDGSTDSTVSIISKYSDPRIKLIVNDKNEGLVYTLNKGLEIAQGKYIARMDADDISLPDRLTKQFYYMERTGIAVLSCAFSFLGTPHEIHFPTDSERISIKLLDNTALLHPGVIFSNDVVQKEKLRYRSEYKHAEDYQMWVQFAQKGLELGNLDDVLVYYRQHEGQISITKQIEQDIIKEKIKFEFLSFFFKNHFSDKEMLSVNAINDIPFHEKVILFDQINKVNIQCNYFKPFLFRKHLIELLYKNKDTSKKMPFIYLLKMIKNNVNFEFIAAALKIKFSR